MLSLLASTAFRPVSLLSSLASSSARAAFSTSPILEATKKGGGSSKNNRGTAGKRLGVKKFGGELVQPGDVIIRQRGSKIHPGQHVQMGRDHTLTALTPGYLCFYRLPHDRKRATLSPNIPNCYPWQAKQKQPIPETRNPKHTRRYVGVVFRRDEKLPRDEAAQGRDRRFFGVVETPEDRTAYEWDAKAKGEEGRWVDRAANVTGRGEALEASSSSAPSPSP